MRNLRNITYRTGKATSNITSICWDAGKDEVLVTCGPSEVDARIELLRIVEDIPGLEGAAQLLQCKRIASWDAPSPSPDLLVDRIVSLHYFGDSATICLVLEGGDIVVVEEGLTPEDAHIEIMGSIDAGITAARWSPDEELLIITTKADTVIFMSRSFDGITDATMTSDDLKASKHVSVGWGKKETQFQGKGAKAKGGLRDPTIPERVDEGRLSPNDDGRTTISWRGDGAYVAINSIEAALRRVIRVYTRDGVLDNVSEPVDGLEGSLSWRPSGNLMAGIQRFTDHIDVVFFERNGLRHGQFSLLSTATEPLNDPSVHISLEWNSDSTVLAVKINGTVQLWTMGNYFWYLKQEIRLGPPCSHITWHPEKALRLAAAASSELLHTEYVFTVARGSLMPPHDYGLVGVVHGQTVKVTPFRTHNIPPPMSIHEIEAGSNVIDVAFAQDNSALAILHHKGIDLVEWQTKKARNGIILIPGKVAKYVFDHAGDGDRRASLQICFANDGPCLLQTGQGLEISRFTLDKSSGTLLIDATLPVPAESVTSLYNSGGLQEAFVQSKSGKLRKLSTGFDLEPVSAKFPVQSPWVETVKVDGDIVAFGLSRGGHLYANTRLLAKNCTSYLVTSDHLILTTSNHFLKFVHLGSPEDLEVPPDDPENDERCRSIERGAKLVTAISTTLSVVLQMPRGNLETIYPRAMVLAGVRQLVDQKEYGKAFAHCRTQRVDMNILYDHNPEQFLSNVVLFLDQLKELTYIDLFLASLREEDVTETMYKDTKKAKRTPLAYGISTVDSASPSPKGAGSKINPICDAVLKTLGVRKKSTLQNIITANVCKNPPALDDGLQVVAELMQEDEALAEKAVEHICFLQDVNRLYDHALGLYNLDLALLVAQQSQRDPREYLPFMQNLHQMTELRRKFAIDDHLGRREKGLQHLHDLNVFDEVQDYTVKHSLYSAALRLYRYDADRHNILTELYAAYLATQSKYREAGLAYESLNNFAKATTCYRQAGATSWRECLFTAQQQTPPLAESFLAELATALADALYEAKDYASAATVHLEHLDSIESAVRCLCKGYHFADAMRLIVLRGGARTAALLDSSLDTGLADALSSSTEFLADCKAQLRAQVPRIAELRRKAIEDPLAFYEGERPSTLVDVPDDVSVASTRVSTSASLFTRYTGKVGSVGTVGSNVSRATSKNRKREEKKRARGRKGTVYEAEYLVNSVRRLIERVESSKGEVEKLVFGLMRRNMSERARAVEVLMDEVVEGCRAAVQEVFVAAGGEADGGTQDQQGAVEQTMFGPGAEGVLQESLDAMSSKQAAPLITSFSKLSLLG